jgi:hypothetical protein
LSFLSKILFEARLLLKKREEKIEKKEREGPSFKVQNERSYHQVKEHSKIRLSPNLFTTYIFSTIS